MEAEIANRTTLNIDETLLVRAMELSGSRTKTDAINLALGEFIRRREREALTQELGSFDLDLSPELLKRLRAAG